MTRHRWVVSALLAIAHVGCKGCNEAGTSAPGGPTASTSASASVAAPDVDTAPAKAVVGEYFTAMAVKDCASIMPLVKASDYTKEKCKEDVDEFEEHQTSLLRIVSATVDGRDPKRVLVTVRVRYSGKERDQIVGTSRDGDAWKVEK